jgi:hypothetical protein
MKQLKELRLNDCKELSCIAVLAMLHQFTSLKKVQLQDYYIRAMKGVKVAALTHIESLDIRCTKYSQVYDLKKFVCRFAQLRSLFLSNLTEEFSESYK